MRDFAFYNAGCEPSGSWRRSLIVGPRRLLRRLLRPIFQQQERIDHDFQDRFDALDARLAGLARELSAVAALGWDHVAIARRLAALEDEVERLREELADRPIGAIPRPHLHALNEAVH